MSVEINLSNCDLENLDEINELPKDAIDLDLSINRLTTIPP
jgi:hypothetical protein